MRPFHVSLDGCRGANAVKGREGGILDDRIRFNGQWLIKTRDLVPPD
jgi:hypothetical protein